MAEAVLLRRAMAVAATGLSPLVVTAVLSPVLVHRLGPTAFGVWSLVSTSIALVVSFDLGVSGSAWRFLGRDPTPADRQRLLLSLGGVVALGAAAAAAVCYLLDRPILRLLGVAAGDRSGALALIHMLPVIVALPLIQGLVITADQVRGRFWRPAAASLLGQGSYVLGALHATREDGGLAQLGRALLLSQVLSLVVLLVPRRVQFRRGAIVLSRSAWRELASYGLRTQLANFWGFVNLEADALVVAVFLDVRRVGYYALALAVASGLRVLPEVLLRPLYADLAGRAGTPEDSIRAHAVVLQRLWMRTLSPYLGSAAVVAFVGTLAWLGDGFRVTAGVALVLTLGNAVNLGTGVLSSLARVLGRPELEARYGFVSAVVNVGVTCALTPVVGLAGVCVGTALGQVAGSLAFLRIMRPVAGPSFPIFPAELRLVAFALSTVATAGLALLARHLLPTGVVGLIGVGLALLAVVGVANRVSEGTLWSGKALRSGLTKPWLA